MIRTILSSVFDGDGRVVVGAGTLGAAASWSWSAIGSAVIMLLSITILCIKLYKALRDIDKPE
jgi:hypothetical protein